MAMVPLVRLVVVAAAVVVAFSQQFAFWLMTTCCEGKNSWGCSKMQGDAICSDLGLRLDLERLGTQ